MCSTNRTCQKKCAMLTGRSGKLPAPDAHAKDAIQAHCCSPQENRVGLPVALSPAFSREPQEETYWLCIFCKLSRLRFIVLYRQLATSTVSGQLWSRRRSISIRSEQHPII